MIKTKKAQGLSLNTIIIAAVVLIVLIVLWAIFTGRMGQFGEGVDDQQKKTDLEVGKIKQQLGLDTSGTGTGSCKVITGKKCNEVSLSTTSEDNCHSIGCDGNQGMLLFRKCTGDHRPTCPIADPNECNNYKPICEWGG